MLESCLYLLREFIVSSLGYNTGVWRFAEEDGKVILVTRELNSFGKMQWVGFVYDIENDSIGYSYIDGKLDNFSKALSNGIFSRGALFSIRASLRNLSSIPIRVKKIDFSPDPMGFCDGFISESNEEKGSYDIELW